MTSTPDALVTEFCAAWTRMDADELAAYFTDDGVYHNIPMAPAEGREAVRAMLEGHEVDDHAASASRCTTRWRTAAS